MSSIEMDRLNYYTEGEKNVKKKSNISSKKLCFQGFKAGFVYVVGVKKTAAVRWQPR